jgi:DNA-directed RNA polymerase specialized sigma24 family protein
MTEFNLDDAIAVAREEAREDAIVKTRQERNAEIVRNAFAEGFPIDAICKITGLDMNTVKTLATTQPR